MLYVEVKFGERGEIRSMDVFNWFDSSTPTPNALFWVTVYFYVVTILRVGTWPNSLEV